MKHPLMYFLLLLLTGPSINTSFAQSNGMKNNTKPSYTNVYLGIGFGQDYGGIGIRAEYRPLKNIGIFASAGYALIDPALNLGISAKLLPDKKFCPTLSAMYGYNAVIKLKDYTGSTSADSKIYYGPSIGLGAELRMGKNNKDNLSFGICVPFRNSEFHKDYDALKAGGYEFNPDFLPITFTLGINFGLNQKSHEK